MSRSIKLLGAVVAVLVAVGCGPPDADELSEQGQEMKATPILMGASCQAASTCGQDVERCSEWSAPASCGGPSTCTVVQYQTCVDSRGNECINVALSPASTEGCN
jgi:hypothetical protein